jgi:hypothetical protein
MAELPFFLPHAAGKSRSLFLRIFMPFFSFVTHFPSIHHRHVFSNLQTFNNDLESGACPAEELSVSLTPSLTPRLTPNPTPSLTLNLTRGLTPSFRIRHTPFFAFVTPHFSHLSPPPVPGRRRGTQSDGSTRLRARRATPRRAQRRLPHPRSLSDAWDERGRTAAGGDQLADRASRGSPRGFG